MGTGCQPSHWEALSALTVPCLLIAGALDEKYVQIARMMQEKLPLATIQIVEGSGHAVHLEKADLFAALIARFLGEHHAGHF